MSEQPGAASSRWARGPLGALAASSATTAMSPPDPGLVPPNRDRGSGDDGAAARDGLPRSMPASCQADNVAKCRYMNSERALVKVHVLQVDQKPENIAELRAGIAAGRTVDDWQMP